MHVPEVALPAHRKPRHRWFVRLQSPALAWLVVSAACESSENVGRSGTEVDCSSCAIELEHVATVSDSVQPGLLLPLASTQMTRDRAGRLFVTTMGFEHIAVFDSAGNFETLVGNAGRGPGEFSRAVAPLVGPGDSLHVYDVGQRKVVVFSPALRFARQNLIPAHPQVVLADGSYITAVAMASPERIGYPVHHIDPAGTVLKSFGVDTPQDRTDSGPRHERRVAQDADGRVWTVAPASLQFARWDVRRGERTWQAQSDWSRRADLASEPARDPRIVRPAPVVVSMWHDAAGRVWVLVRDADADWKRTLAREPDHEVPIEEEELDQLYDSILIVSDPESASVLAERRFPKFMRWYDGNILVSLNRVDLIQTVFDIWRPVLVRPSTH